MTIIKKKKLYAPVLDHRAAQFPLEKKSFAPDRLIIIIIIIFVAIDYWILVIVMKLLLLLFIECPPAEDGMERFACPKPDAMHRYRCIDDHVLCDGFIDCPQGEDEDGQACMFYKTVRHCIFFFQSTRCPFCFPSLFFFYGKFKK